MKKWIPSFLVILGLAGAGPLAAEKSDGFVDLFNGKDLTGWDSVEGAWTVENGAIKCTGQADGKKNWLIWRGGELADFELRLQFKFTSGNSGVQVRSNDLGKHQVRGYQVEIAAKKVMGLWHHSLSPEKYRSHLATAGQKGKISATGEKSAEQVADPAEVQKVVRDGEWNDLVVVAKGSKLIQIVNGVVLAELVDEDEVHSARSGVLAFQDHGKGTVAEFRKVRLKRF